MLTASSPFVLLGIGFGLIFMTLALARHLLRGTSLPVVQVFFLALAALLSSSYLALLFVGVQKLGSHVAEADAPLPLATPDETPLIELSVADASAPLPDWVNAPPRLVGDRYEISVASDPKLTEAEARADLLEKSQAATRKYIDDLLGAGAREISLGRELIVDRLQQATHMQPIKLSVGEMQIAHALLAFDNTIRDEFRQQRKAAETRRRMTQTGLFAGLALAALATVFGYLKLDTLSRGFYTGRLQLAAAALLLGVIAVGWLLA